MQVRMADLIGAPGKGGAAVAATTGVERLKQNNRNGDNTGPQQQDQRQLGDFHVIVFAGLTRPLLARNVALGAPGVSRTACWRLHRDQPRGVAGLEHLNCTARVHSPSGGTARAKLSTTRRRQNITAVRPLP
jgi:hypothetical protein